MTRPQYKPRPQYRGVPRLRRGATSVWGSRRATASPGRDERLGVEARHGFAGARRAVGGRGAPRLRRGATSGWGSRRATASPGRDERLGGMGGHFGAPHLLRTGRIRLQPKRIVLSLEVAGEDHLRVGGC